MISSSQGFDIILAKVYTSKAIGCLKDQNYRMYIKMESQCAYQVNSLGLEPDATAF